MYKSTNEKLVKYHSVFLISMVFFIGLCQYSEATQERLSDRMDRRDLEHSYKTRQIASDTLVVIFGKALSRNVTIAPSHEEKKKVRVSANDNWSLPVAVDYKTTTNAFPDITRQSLSNNNVTSYALRNISEEYHDTINVAQEENIHAVPEPSSLLLFGLGIGGIVYLTKCRKYILRHPK